MVFLAAYTHVANADLTVSTFYPVYGEITDGTIAGITANPEPNTVHPYLGYNFIYDDNLFHLSDAVNPVTVLGKSHIDDEIHQVIAGLDGNWRISRQEFILKANINNNNFTRFANLNFVGWYTLAQWNWRVGDDWNGRAGYTNSRTLGSYAQLQLPIRNTPEQQNVFFDATYAFGTRWRILGATNHFELSYPERLLQSIDRTENTGEMELQYISPIEENRFGLRGRITEGSYPNRPVIPQQDNSYEQEELLGTVDWRYSGLVRLRGQLGYTDRHHPHVASQNFSGVTGGGTLDWEWSGKTSFTFTAWRQIVPYESIGTNYVLSEGISASPTWLARNNLNVSARIAYENQNFQGSVAPRLPTRVDDYITFSLAADYKLLRYVNLGLVYQWQQRDSNIQIDNYTDNVVAATVRLGL